MINEVRLMGFFGADPEKRETNGGEYTYARFPLSLYRRSTNRDVKGNFIQCEGWNQTGDIIMNVGKKGERAIIEGELRVDVWKNDDDETRSRTYLRVSRIIFVDRKGEEIFKNINTDQNKKKNDQPKNNNQKDEKKEKVDDLFEGFDI